LITKEENDILTHTGPGTMMGELYRRFWTPIMHSKDLPARDCPPVRVTIMGEDLVAFRDSYGKIGLIEEYCAHRRASLFFGRNEDGGLRCVYHGWKYAADGQCLDTPNEPPELNLKDQVKLRAYTTMEKAGIIWAYMGPPELKPEFPQMEWTMVPDSHRWVGKVHVDVNYLQQQEGNFDSTHALLLHLGKNAAQVDMGVSAGFGRAQRQGPKLKGYWMVWEPRETEYGIMAASRRPLEGDDDSYAWHLNHFLMPWTALVAGGTPGTPFLTDIHIPETDESHWTWVVHWHPDRPLTDQEVYDYENGYGFLPELIPGTYEPKRNRDNNYLIERGLQRTFNFTGIGRSFFEQDMAMTSRQGPGRIADRSEEYVGTADAMIIALRRVLLKAAKDLQKGKEPKWVKNIEAYKVRSMDIVLPKDVDPADGAREWITGEKAWVKATDN